MEMNDTTGADASTLDAGFRLGYGTGAIIESATNPSNSSNGARRRRLSVLDGHGQDTASPSPAATGDWQSSQQARSTPPSRARKLPSMLSKRLEQLLDENSGSSSDSGAGSSSDSDYGSVMQA